VTLFAFTADHRAAMRRAAGRRAAMRRAAAAPLLLGAGRAAIDRYLLQQTRRTLLQWSINGTDRRTDTVPLHRPCRILSKQCQKCMEKPIA